MKNLNDIYGNFKDTIENTNIQRYWEETECSYANYLKKKQINLNNFKSEKELKNYLQDLIAFFRVQRLWNKIADSIWVNYYKPISDFFHARIDEIIRSWKWEWIDDTYEFLLKEERKKLQQWFNKAVSESLKENFWL